MNNNKILKKISTLLKFCVATLVPTGFAYKLLDGELSLIGGMAVAMFSSVLGAIAVLILEIANELPAVIEAIRSSRDT